MISTSWVALFLSVVGLLGAFGDVGPQLRAQLPSVHAAPLIGFTFTDSDISLSSTPVDLIWNPTTGNFELPFGTGNTISVFDVPGEVDNFCEIVNPLLLNPEDSSFDSPEILDVQPRRAYIFHFSGLSGPNSYLVIWVSDESYLPSSVVFQYQVWYDAPNIDGEAPACAPTVSRVYPPVIWSQGSIIHIHGENFGSNINEITVDVGGYACSQQELVVSQSVIKCVLNPLGNAPSGLHPVTVKVNTNTGAAQTGVYFSGGCTLICLDNTFPNSKCEQCVSFDATCSGSGGGGSTESQSITVEQLSEYFISDLVRGQKASDDNFLVVADTYKNSLLEKFPMPRYSIPEADVHISVAVHSALPRLQIVPVTQLLENFPADSLSKFEFKLIADEARWTKTQNGTEVSYRLEF